MKNVIFIAPPAAGKGTQSELLVSEYNYNHISTGDLLREKQNDGSELGNHIKELLSTGCLIDDDIVTTLLKERLKNITGPFILDGYPRNIKQAIILQIILSDLDKKIDAVIYLNVDETTAMKRALGRITCPNCNRNYNKYDEALKPKNEDMCDYCNIKLISRSDDNEETFKVRFNNYIKNTKPLLDYYEKKNLLYIIDNKKTPEEMFESIKEVIK